MEEVRMTVTESPCIEVLSDERQQIIDWVRRWGGCASTAALDPACQHFTIPHVEGLISYRLEYGCAVVFGDPICDPKDIDLLSSAFHEHCDQLGKTIVYVTTTKEFATWALQNTCNCKVEFGHELCIDPQCDPRSKTGVNASLVRRKVRRALKDGVTSHEYLAYDADLESAMEQVGEEWLKDRKGLQIYIAGIRLFGDRPGKRWFYARHGDRVIGILQLNRLKARDGWLLNRLMVTPDAPGGTPELLVISALETLKHEGCRLVSFGVTPSEELGEMEGIGKLSGWLAKKAYGGIMRYFRLAGQKKFWEKFAPESAPLYLLFSRKWIGPREILGIMRAMNVSL